jgi:ribose 5-phosphate isomerase B
MIAIGSDHAGYELKEAIIKYLINSNIEVLDLGTNNGITSVDYPDYGEKVALEVASGRANKGIIICGTGIGISLAANKVSGIRSAVCTNEYMAKMARMHNNANILSLGARVIGVGLAEAIVETFITTEFDSENTRHGCRVNKIMNIEKNKNER